MTDTAETVLNIDALRADTPGVAHRAHFNNAGAALIAKPVLAAVQNYLVRESEIGGYEAAAEHYDELNAVYGSVARLIGARPDEISIAENATIAWQRAFYAMQFRSGDRILTANAEFAANYIAFLQVAERTGASIEVVPNDEAGALDPSALEAMLDERVRLIAVTWIPTNGGLVNPAEEVGRIARKYGIPFLLDACQAVGQMPIDVEALNCDMLTATGRKYLRAPRGTGFLYIRKAVLDRTEPAMLDLFGATMTGPSTYRLRPDARRFETWETNYSTRMGLNAAVEYALAVGLQAIEGRCAELTNTLRSELAEIQGIRLHDLGRRRAAILSLTVDGVEAAEVMRRLTAMGINVSVSPPTSTPIDAAARQLPPVVRVSPHYYNSNDEIERVASAIRTIAKARGS
ncbi:aminotransferase class V-fold PLP-dependent enzyme [Bosea lathyri]|uniref:Selenocysteine lyase/Cysteine desulfurase n=1 Tax=Bosea lathyri TaxID=1036778 RepID=A0A1H6CAH6_9HYPH|nr:aminotransferase class V-fold PLP-dependent enzyme [Bosea lathyri]SEG69971.1 Selenocysteine lyase/Cysteine desulfurase [Bosea lathyri]